MPDITQWLSELGLDKFVKAFTEAEIDFTDLPFLTTEDLKELGLPIGPRRRVENAIKLLGDDANTYLPQPVPTVTAVEPVVPAQPVAYEAERRQLTVMFVDLVGSTQMATQIDAEDMRNIITGYQNTVAGVVSRHDGFIARYMGDGVLCYFGWPRANEDDAERAVRAGLEIIEGVQSASGPAAAALASRVGIATGVVVVGDLIGTGAAQEAAVVGETPNLAARLQGLAQPNQLVIAQETQKLLGNVFELQAIKAQQLKGIAEAVNVYVVKEEVARESRFDARQSGVLTDIVGRTQELQLMRDCWAKAKAGAGQMVVVSGEAGIGKSRITRALIDEIAQQPHVRITFQCSPYHADSAFYPIIQQLNFAAGILPSDSSRERLDKLERVPGIESIPIALVANLLGIDAADCYPPLDLTLTQSRARTLQGLVELLVSQSDAQPLLAIIEDLHWVDPTTLEWLDMALDAIADRPILLLSTARPTFEHGFGAHPIVSRFALNRLGHEQIREIVSRLTDGRALADETVAIIAQRTDGVPLFVEELTKTILESGALKDDGDRLVLDDPLNTIAIPATLHDSLMARLDRLQPIKEVAQTAACIGREFTHGLLLQISPLSDTELGSVLDGLIEAELIYRRGIPPDATYQFKHALVRDAAYESLLKEKRRAVHTRILMTLETDSNIAPEILALHAESANLTDRAIDLWEAAGKAALTRPAYDEAISHLGRAIALITPQLENSNSPPLERALALQIPLGMALLTRRGFAADETLEAYEKALIIADKIGETPMRYLILDGLWISAGVRGQYADALRTAEAFVEAMANSPNTPSLVAANRVAGASHYWIGNFTEAQRYLDVALANYDPIAHAGLANQFGLEVGVLVHSFQAFNLLALGLTRRAANHMEKTESLAMTTGHIQTICNTLSQRALRYSLLSRDHSDFERCLNKLTPIALEHNLTHWNRMTSIMAEILAARKGDNTSIARYLKLDAAISAANYKMGVAHWRVDVGRSALTMGLHEEATRLSVMAQELIEETGEFYALSDVHRLQASIAKTLDDTKTAEEHLLTALDVARRQGSKFWELRAAIDLARLWQEQDRIDEAVALLNVVQNSIAKGDCPEDSIIAQAIRKEFTT